MRKTVITLGCLIAIFGAIGNRAHAVLINIAGQAAGGVASANWASSQAQFGNDGSIGTSYNGDFSNGGVEWQVVFNDTSGVPLDNITLFPRQDCCADRLDTFQVELFDAEVGGNSLWSVTSTTQVAGSGRTYDLTGDNITTARRMVITDQQTGAAGSIHFNFGEAQVFADDGVAPGTFGNLANMFGTASQSTLGFGLPAINANDGNLGTVSHTDSGDLTPSLSVDLGDLYRIEEIVLTTRTDCCTPAQPERDYNLTIEVLDASGAVVFTNPVINSWNGVGAATDLGVGASFTVDLSGMPGGGVVGQSLRVSKGSFAGTEWLSIAELEANGNLTPVPEPSSIALIGLALGGLLLRRTRRRDGQIV